MVYALEASNISKKNCFEICDRLKGKGSLCAGMIFQYKHLKFPTPIDFVHNSES